MEDEIYVDLGIQCTCGSDYAYYDSVFEFYRCEECGLIWEGRATNETNETEVKQNLMEDRIVDLAFTPWDELPEKLQELNLHVEICDQGKVIRIRNSILELGLTDTDPQVTAAVIAFMLSGVLWSRIYPDLIDKVDDEELRRNF